MELPEDEVYRRDVGLRSVLGAVVVDANWVDAIEKTVASRGYMK